MWYKSSGSYQNHYLQYQNLAKLLIFHRNYSKLSDNQSILDLLDRAKRARDPSQVCIFYLKPIIDGD